METTTIAPTERSAVQRQKARGNYEREVIYEILDEGLVCHVGFVVDGRPFVIPMGYGRLGDRLILHGSVASRLIRELAAGIDVCVTVTLLDGLVLARSTFHHSMNYRSVVAFGRATLITDPAAKSLALDALVEHLVPGRTREVRGSSTKELAATDVLELPLDEASAKIRVGPPKDAPEDLSATAWAGVVPLALTALDPLPSPDLQPGIAPTDAVRRSQHRGRKTAAW